jgi:hypothetical protein
MEITEADMRRAGALITHFGQGSDEGVNAILEEAVKAGRCLSLLLAVLAVYNELVPELRSEMGMQLMGSAVLKLAQMEAQQ